MEFQLFAMLQCEIVSEILCCLTFYSDSTESENRTPDFSQTIGFFWILKCDCSNSHIVVDSVCTMWRIVTHPVLSHKRSLLYGSPYPTNRIYHWVCRTEYQPNINFSFYFIWLPLFVQHACSRPEWLSRRMSAYDEFSIVILLLVASFGCHYLIYWDVLSIFYM